MILLATDVAAAGRDTVTTRLKQLTDGSAFKVRLSAAVSLGKSRDPRAIIALAYAVRKDSSATVRRVAVAGLARIVTRSKMTASSVTDAITAIDYAARKDKSKKVRRTAKKAQRKVAKLRRQSAKRAAAVKHAPKPDEKMFLAVGQAVDPRRRAPRGTTNQMGSRVRSAIKRGAPEYDIGSVTDSRSRRNVYYVGATVSEVRTKRSGSRAEVRCKVTVRVSPMRDGREHFIAGESASAKGTGRVVGASSARAIADSKRECVLAVVERVTERQVVPFIQRVATND